jgi:hypothetical protein
MKTRGLHAGVLSLAAVGLLAFGLHGCGSQRCFPAFEVLEVVTTNDARGVPCNVRLANGSRSAEYTVAAPTDPDGGVPPAPGPGGCFEPDFASPCVPVSGPALSYPNQCNRGGCEFTLSLSGANAHAVADFLGSDTFELTLTCGGKLLSQRKVSFTREICPV